MKLLFRGGLNKHTPRGYEKSYLYEYSDVVKKLITEERKMCFVTMAKPDGHFDEHIIPQFSNKVDIIGREISEVYWKRYDLIFLCGGSNLSLLEGLERTNFDLYNLKDTVVVCGDSAGAMVMAPYLYNIEDRVTIEFLKGIYPITNTIVIPHLNNPRYCTGTLLSECEKFGKEKEIDVLKLKENETKLFDQDSGKFVDFEFDKLFS